MGGYINRKIFTIDEIKSVLERKIGTEIEAFYLVSTEGYDLTTNPKGRNSKKSRSTWADVVVKELFNIERKQIAKVCPKKRSTGEYNFSYIKLARDASGSVFGIVHGKSSFHCMYPSDVWFYNFTNVKKGDLEKFMNQYGLEWYTKEIIIIKNKNSQDCREAYINEGKLREWFNTCD